MARIPAVLQEHINTAFPDFVSLVGTALPDGYAQITPRGGTMVYDDEHLALWERGKGSTAKNMADGTKVTVYFRKPSLRADGTLPLGGIARFYGTAQIYQSGAGIRGGLASAGAAGEGSRSGEEGLRGADQGGAGRGSERGTTAGRLNHAGVMNMDDVEIPFQGIHVHPDRQSGRHRQDHPTGGGDRPVHHRRRGAGCRQHVGASP